MTNPSPLLFARAIQQAVDYRRAGMAPISAVQQACHTVGIPVDFALPIQLILEGSMTLAEGWCERIVNNALDRAYAGKDDFR